MDGWLGLRYSEGPRRGISDIIVDRSDSIARYFFFEDPSGKASIYGQLEQGVVEFAVLAMPDSPVRGTALLRLMMLDFGDGVKAIRGVWRKGSDPSINIDKVNELTSLGMALEEAIQHAWTVTRARKLGFNKVAILGKPVGIPGAYTKIDVLIEK